MGFKADNGRLDMRAFLYFWMGLSILLWAGIMWYTAGKNAEYRKQILEGRMWVKGVQLGWFNNYPIDLSDPQWKTLREFMIPLLVGMFVHVSLSSLSRRIHQQANIIFYIVTNIVFVYFLHGRGIVFVALAGMVCFAVGQTFKGSWLNPALTWAVCIIVNCSSDWYRGFEGTRFREMLGDWASGIDWYQGVYSWQTQFNLSMLRYISYNMELYWACRQESGEGFAMDSRSTPGEGGNLQHGVSGKREEEKGGCPRDRGAGGKGEYNVRKEIDHVVGVEAFTLSNFVAYVYYIPLYIAGPISPFNSWHHHAMSRPHKPAASPLRLLRDLVFVALYTLMLELLLHFWYYVSINNTRTWAYSLQYTGQAMPGWEVAWGGLHTLQFMYLKFLVIWRFFRIWSMADGIDVPENMNRCVNNNFTFAGFWRQWHASLNKWIIKYLYKPLGGTRTQHWNIWVIFTFIGLWHDLLWRWLAWAWLNCIFFSIELGVAHLTKHSKFTENTFVGLLVSGVAGSVNIHLLIIANLAIMHGFEGSLEFVRSIFTATDSGRYNNGSMWVLVFSILFFFVNTMSMQATRRWEGITVGTKRF